MKDFDIDRNSSPAEARRFRFHGVEFTRRDRVKPETIALIEDAPFLTTAAESLKALDDAIIGMIEPDDLAKWRTLRDPDDSPVDMADMRALAAWLVEEMSGLPTERLSESSPGADATARSSTGSSSAREDLAA